MLACRAFGENRARLAKAVTPEEKGETTRPVERERRIVAGNGGAEQKEKRIQESGGRQEPSQLMKTRPVLKFRVGKTNNFGRKQQ